ncbi:putative transposase of IS4/5 family [Sesbania bispinosa]|nr:putative transposase of IS4/5 family [Sesbania bispinosa]
MTLLFASLMDMGVVGFKKRKDFLEGKMWPRAHYQVPQGVRENGVPDMEF